MKTPRPIAMALTLLLSGCAAVTHFERYEEGSTRTRNAAFRDLRITLKGFKPHANQYFEAWVVSEDNVLQTSATLSPLGSGDVEIFLPNAVPRTRECRLDFFADVNATHGYDGIGEVRGNDHAWRVPRLNALEGTFGRVTDRVVEVTYTHDVNFTDIEATPAGMRERPRHTATDGKVRVTPGELAGRMIEVRFVDHVSQHTVAMHRAMLGAEPYDVFALGALETGADYDIEIFADANGNGAYDLPSRGGDRGWRISRTATTAGIVLEFDPSAFTDGHVDVAMTP